MIRDDMCVCGDMNRRTAQEQADKFAMNNAFILGIQNICCVSGPGVPIRHIMRVVGKVKVYHIDVSELTKRQPREVQNVK